MKGELTTKNYLQRGVSTLEMLIALALLILSISTAVAVAFGNQSVGIDSQTSSEAINKAQAALETARALSRQNFASVATLATTTDDIYSKQTFIDPSSVTQCGENAASNIAWTSDKNRSEGVSFSTHLSNVPLSVALGGNCDNTPPGGTWNPPATWASSNFNPGKPTGLDALNRVVYMTADKSPYLDIADTSGSTLGQSSGLFTSFTNGFADDFVLNDIKVAKYPNGNTYGFVARNSSTKQFEVLNLSNINQPVSIASSSLAGVSGSAPQGWRLYYFDSKVYIVTRFTAGPELHIFDVSNPVSPVELGSKDLGRTVEDLIVTKQFFGGSWHYFAFMATDKNSAPLSIYDVTTPASVTELTGAEPTFTDYQDGWAVYLLGNKLYFGRASDPSGPDLFVYTVPYPFTGAAALPLAGQADIGTSVIGLAVSGNFAFLATSKVSKEFQVYKSDPANLTLIATFNFPNVITNGDKYENNWVYVASQGNDALRILYSP